MLIPQKEIIDANFAMRVQLIVNIAIIITILFHALIVCPRQIIRNMDYNIVNKILYYCKLKKYF